MSIDIRKKEATDTCAHPKRVHEAFFSPFRFFSFDETFDEQRTRRRIFYAHMSPYLSALDLCPHKTGTLTA